VSAVPLASSGRRRLAAGLGVACLATGCSSVGSGPPGRGSGRSTSRTAGAQVDSAKAHTPTAYSGHVQLGRGERQRLLTIPGVATFSAACTRQRRPRLSFAIKDVSANVTIATGAHIVARPNPRPGRPIPVPFQTPRAGAASIQIAQVAPGFTKVATVQIAAGPEPGTAFSCEVSAQAVVTTIPPPGP
jgi:hypothetical protein